ncbi:DUF3152 domain-containing protein [Streptomyces sp. NPDC057307]|uniref:DUF3152 domain-containing protein n=1 Tax=Streptomyces sp. NPDC057307 TaxID=3346096 RepID=UPI0036291F3D
MRHADNRRARKALHPADSRRRGIRGRTSRRVVRERAARRRRLLGLAAVAVVALTAFGAVRWQSEGPSPAGRAAASPRPPSTALPSSPSAARDGSPSPSPSASASSPRAEESSTDDGVAKSGTGVFSTAVASGGPVGEGTIRRYTVQVEGGTGVSASGAAKEIAAVLGDRRGWIANGRDGFQLVSSGPGDFEVKIATPDTVDRICGAAGLRTRGEVNCNVGNQVIVNLKRWLTGSPQFSGSLSEYRALIINHEVGHRIGHGHESCPGPGRPAPVMMQQIDGLRGCRANAWPYDTSGVYLEGPSVP